MNARRMPARLVAAKPFCALAATLVLGLGLGNVEERRPEPVRARPAAPSVARVEAPRPAPDAACEARRAELAGARELPGAPGLTARRSEIVARAKAEPVIFVRRPEPSTPSARAAELRRRLFSEPSPWTALEDVYDALRDSPAELRQVLLTDGYLYAEEPGLAALLTQSVALTQLFREPRVVVERGSARLTAERRAGDYVWADGPEQGAPARLWLFDRVAAEGAPPLPPLHLALADLARAGATEIEIERLTEAGILARLHYGPHATRAVLGASGGRVALECEIVPPAARAAIEAAKERVSRRGRAVAALRDVVLQQIDEALPFDEPHTEEGQQDGKLRPEWRLAYLRGATSYRFNDDRYWVFDRNGRPRVPQVCADFIVDSWERMAGTWWPKRGEARARRVGRINFEELAIENRRSVEQLIEFARAHPDWFELLDVPPEERVTFRDRRRFFQRLSERRAEFQPGDVVAILGPRSDDQLHYHSFFVLAADPLTGMPTLLAANAGRPRIRSWEGEMQNAPRRSIVARIRPRLSWFERVLGSGDGQATGQTSSPKPASG